MQRSWCPVVFGLAVLFTSGPARADTWPTYAEIGTTLSALEATYPNLCRRFSIGRSVEGRNIWAIQISDNVFVQEDEPEFKYISTIHGDEIVGTKMLMMLADHLLTNYGTDPQATNIVNEVELWLVPLMNPDGYDRTPRRRENAHVVDLNRNFPDLGDPDSPIGREDETAVIMNWDAQHDFVASANLHTGVMVVNYPFDNYDTGSNLSPDNDLFIWMSEEYSWYNQPMWNGAWYHGITNGADWYVIHGGMQDWNYHFRGCNEVTIEISNDDQPPATLIPQYWNDNGDALMSYLETCLVGVRGIITDYNSGLPLDATIVVVGRNHEVYSDPDVGDYHRMLLPGTYDLTFSATGFNSLTLSGVVVFPGDATRLDVELGAPQTVVVSPDGGEVLPAGVETQVIWSGSTNRSYHVQYTANADDVAPTIDDFEDGSLGGDYATGGDADWFVTSSESHGGSYAARSGVISHNDESWMTRTVGGGDLSFWYRVSSEGGYDYFDFYVDGTREIHASGTAGGWTYYSTPLPAGSHELRWEYNKDVNTTHGSDTVWIDDLTIMVDSTVWTDIVAETNVGDLATNWVPPAEGDAYKVRVRAHYGSGVFGAFDESDGVFSVTAATADGDYDQDGDVDLQDFAAFQGCMEQSAAGLCGAAFEFVSDGMIDLQDYAGFDERITGP